jgi:UPF0755 protein
MGEEVKKKILFLAILAALGGGLFLLIYNFLTPSEIVPLKLIRITIPEGFNVRQIGSRLEEAGLFRAEEFTKVALKEEGFLFPDTYEFYAETTPESVISKMKKNFEVKVDSDILAEAKRQGRSLREIVIMASLLEEEAASDKDWKIIAGILWKRIEERMPLAVDAALTYVTGRASSKLTDDDLALDSPYNTYKYNGLPAGPISNPGLGAMDAALNPTPSAYWFYLSDSKGVIHYAKTFEEHKLNKIRYLR